MHIYLYKNKNQFTYSSKIKNGKKKIFYFKLNNNINIDRERKQ